jgi:tRNA A-37 threonylcarbamoyl transferase component Bud32/ribosomal protein L37E
VTGANGLRWWTMALSAATALDLPARLAGRYRILRPIGQGSIAQVVEARDDERDATVALKILYPNLFSNQVIADRFRREALVVRRIEHAHVIRIHDVVESDGLLFLVMELHAGGDLTDRLARSGPLTVPALRELGDQLCGALEAAHRAGVVHRDLKPQNVLVGADPTAIDARLCDFGLARTADLAGLTTRSTVLGTPEYMAPEVITDGYADPRSDIYSLGVLLFEAATGRLPFHAGSPFQMLRKHVAETPPRAGKLRPDLPAHIDDAIARAMGKDPLDRFASAEGLAAALAAPTAAAALVTTAPPDAAVAISPAGAPAAAAKITCRRCGGSINRLAQTCVDCGGRTLRLRTVPNGRAVLVTGPGNVADKLDAGSHAALVRLLDELPAHEASFVELRKRATRLPFFVADNLDEASAGELVARLGAIGFEARVEPRASLRPEEVRAKVRRMGNRYALMGMAFVPIGLNLFATLPVKILGPVFTVALALVGLGLTEMSVAFGLAAVSSRKPLVQLGSAPDAETALQRLARWVPRITRRGDRRLAGRIVDRLDLGAQLGAGDAANVLAERAALACQGLVALTDETRHLDEAELRRAVADGDAASDVTAALDRLREAERLRGVIVADLLRVFSRADQLCISAARIATLDAGEKAAQLARELASLESEVAAEEDVAALLS